MPVDLASLVIKIETVGATTATGQLTATANAAAGAEIAANRLAISQNRLVVSQNAAAASAIRVQAATEAAAAAATRAATATIAYDAAMTRAAAASARLAATQATVSTSAIGAVAGMARVGTAINGVTTSAMGAVAGMTRVVPAAAAVVEGTGRVAAATTRVAAATTVASAAATRMGNTFGTVTRDISAGLVTLNQGISGLPYALARVTGPMMLLGIIGVAAFVGIAYAIKKAIGVVDDYQVSLISIAAGLTNVAEAGQGDFGKMFVQNKEFAVGMYRAITLEAVKHFATAQEMMISYNKLVQFGYGVRRDEVAALGVLTDVIKIKTKGQGVERQLNTEIMALMMGQARAGSLLAQELKVRLGPGWAALVDKHKRAGDLLVWMASLFPGIEAANKDILNTIDSQWATTQSLVGLIGIGGLQGLYNSIVDLLKDINTYLLGHEGIIADKLIASWITVKNYVIAIKEGINGISFDNLLPVTSTGFSTLDVFSALITAIEYAIWGMQKLNQAVQWVIDLLKQMSSTAWSIIVDLLGLKTAWDWVTKIYNVVSKSITWHIATVFTRIDTPEKLTRPDTTTSGITQREISQAQLSRKGGTMMWIPGMDYPVEMYDTAPTQTKSKSPPVPPGKGGKGGAGEQQRLNSLFDTLTKERESLIGGKTAEIASNMEKTINQAYKKIEDRAISAAEIEVLAREVAGLKLDKLYTDTALWAAKESGSQTEALKAEETERLRNAQYTNEMSYEDQLKWWNLQQTILGVYNRKRKISEQEIADTVVNSDKAKIDALASSAVLLGDQNRLKQQSLVLENLLAQAAITKSLEQKKELREHETLLRQNQEEIFQAKQLALIKEGWRKEGFGGGLKIGLEGSRKTAETWQADQIASWIQTAPQQISQTMASSFIDYLKGKKMDFEALGYSIAEASIQKQLEGFLTQILPMAIEGLMRLLGIEIPAKQTAAMVAADTLAMGGVNAGIAMVNGAIQAAAILSGSKSGGGSDMLGGFVKIAGSLFGSAIGSSVGAPSYSPSPDTSWGNAAYSSWLKRHSGGMLLPYAHSGLKLASDEVPFIGLTGERVLSRGETIDYERGGSGPPQVNLTINNNAKDTEAKAEQGPTGDIIVTIDQMTAQAYSRRGSLYKAINTGGGATKR